MATPSSGPLEVVRIGVREGGDLNRCRGGTRSEGPRGDLEAHSCPEASRRTVRTHRRAATSVASSLRAAVDALRGSRAPRMPMGLLAVAALLCAACAPTAAQTVCSGGNCYVMGPLGPEWKVISREDGFAGFYQPTSGGVILSNATCRDDAEAAPLSSLTAHLLVGYTARRERSSELVPMAGREALHSVIEARLDGVPVVLDLYVLKRNGCIYDLSYAAPPASYESGLADFRRFVEAFYPLPRPKA